MIDPTPTPEDWDRARRILVAYGPKLLGCDMTPLALEFARVRSEEREGCVKLLRELAEDARDDGDGSDDTLSVALDDAADALRSRGAS